MKEVILQKKMRVLRWKVEQTDRYHFSNRDNEIAKLDEELEETAIKVMRHMDGQREYSQEEYKEMKEKFLELVAIREKIINLNKGFYAARRRKYLQQILDPLPFTLTEIWMNGIMTDEGSFLRHQDTQKVVHKKINLNVREFGLS